MRYAILSDIHANLEALDRVIQDAQAQGVEQFICLGDVVGYGPQPAPAVARVRAVCAVTLAGNHDDAVSGRNPADAFIDLAGDAIARHREALSADDLAWLKTRPWTCELAGGAVCAHGDLCDPAKFYYIEDEADAAANFKASAARLIFVGHTHTPEIFLTGHSGTVYQIEPQDFTLEDGKRYIVNPGSVGYPREAHGQCFSSYVIYDSTEETICYRRLPFSVASVMQRGKAPRKMRWGLLAAYAFAIGILCATLTWLLTPVTEVPLDPALIVAEKVLVPLPSHNRLRANLVLERGSAPVQLKIAYLGHDQQTLAAEEIPVKASSTKALKLPKGTTRIKLTATRLSPDAAVKLQKFDPSVSVK